MLLRSIAVLGVVLSLTACRGEGPSEPYAIEGVYTLRTVNGSVLPATFVVFAEHTRQWTDGAITLNADHTCRIVSQYRELRPGSEDWIAVRHDMPCTFREDGSRLHFVQENGVPFTVTLAGSRISYAPSGGQFLFVFER